MGYLSTARYGFGDITGQQGVAIGQSVAGSGVAIASATGSLAPIAAALGVSVPVLGAIVGAAILGAGYAIQAIMNSGCGQTCIVSTNFANQANAALQQNIAAYFALPVPRPKSSQTAAVANFDMLWNWLQQPQQCGNPALGDAGKRCISDRQAGACTWHQAANTVPPWGTPPAGACWNWFNGYRDPIANDTNVYDDSSEVLQVINGTLTATPIVASGAGASTSLIDGLPSWWPLAAAAVLIGVGVMR